MIGINCKNISRHASSFGSFVDERSNPKSFRVLHSRSFSFRIDARQVFLVLSYRSVFASVRSAIVSRFSIAVPSREHRARVTSGGSRRCERTTTRRDRSRTATTVTDFLFQISLRSNQTDNRRKRKSVVFVRNDEGEPRERIVSFCFIVITCLSVVEEFTFRRTENLVGDTRIETVVRFRSVARIPE